MTKVGRKKIIKKKICKWFGHSFDPIDLMMFEIIAISENKPVAKIKCKRCGEIWIVNN